MITRENAGETVAQDTPSLNVDETVDEVHDEPISNQMGGFSGFASSSMIEDAGGEEEEFGGLMVGALSAFLCFTILTTIQSAIKASKNKKDKKKNKKSGEVISSEPGEVEGTVAADGVDSGTKGAAQVTADDLANEEWGPIKEKKKKDKKKKDRKEKAQADENDQTDGGIFRGMVKRN
jgi:translation initiation factor 5B